MKREVRLRELMDDRRLKNRVKIENLLLVAIGARPCSQTTLPVDLPGGLEMGSEIDRIMTPKMNLIQRQKNPRKRLSTIRDLKKEMRRTYEEVVKTSGQYRAHLSWADELGLKEMIFDVRPTVQELYLFKEKRMGRRLKGLMRERQKIRVNAYSKAKPGMDRVRLAYPEEFEASWLRAMGEALGYPACCVDAYASNRAEGLNVEARAAQQLEEAEGYGKVNPFSYFVGYFFPCNPICEAALSLGNRYLDELRSLDPSIGDLYASLVAENKENVRRQPDIIASFQEKTQGRLNTGS